MSLLAVKGATLAFGGVIAVEDVSLEIGEGEFLGFIGPNGAGKTTLMRIITGALRPMRGSVAFRGADVTRWPMDRRMRAGIGIAQQIARPLRSLSILDNVALAVGARRIGGSPRASLLRGRRDGGERERARELLELVGIGRFAGAMPSEAPHGLLKRLEVARALALEPRLLLLDEPLAGLNQAEARSMADVIAALPGRDRSVLLIEHNIHEVVRVCPSLYVQDNGRRLALGPTEEVMRSPEVRRAYLGGGAS